MAGWMRVQPAYAPIMKRHLLRRLTCARFDLNSRCERSAVIPLLKAVHRVRYGLVPTAQWNGVEMKKVPSDWA